LSPALIFTTYHNHSRNDHNYHDQFLPRDATQSAVMRLHVVCLYVRDVEVCFSYSLEYFQKNFTAK